MPDVICLGLLLADVVGKPIEGFPPKGTLAEVGRMELHVGGNAGNTGISLAKLGVLTGVIGKVGTDGFGDFVMQTLTQHGIDTRGVVRSPVGEASTSATMVAVDAAGERTFLHYPGVHATFTSRDVDFDLIAQTPILHIAGPYLMVNYVGEENAIVLKRAKEMGVTTSLDTVWDFTGRWMSVLEPCLPYLDYLLPSLEEARHITGRQEPSEIARALLDYGVKIAGIKMGADGAYVRTAEGDEIVMPPMRVEAVDALGAGDAWAAGFLCGLVHKWDLERCVRFANAVGACCVEALGATTGVRSFDETVKFCFGA